MNTRHIVSLAVVALAVSVGAQEVRSDGTIGADDRRFDAARAEIQRLIETQKLPAVSVALAKDGKVIWQQAFGYANIEKKIAATPHTTYSLASISKPITATGLMRLVEQKKVDLDRPANDYLEAQLKGLAGDASAATVRRVLSHTAGLPLHYQFFYADLPYAEPPMADTISRYGILVNPPGAVYQYSNLGYGIVDQIIERASGERYAAYMRRDVFEALGMSHTSVHLDERTRGHAAERYEAGGKPIAYYDFNHDGGSAVYACAHDLVRFGMFHLGNRLPEQRAIISEETRHVMRRVETPAGSEQYGLGWSLGEESGMRRISHTGSMPGVTTILNLYPDEDMVAVVLLNTSNAQARGGIAQAVIAPFKPRVTPRVVGRDEITQPPAPPARRPFTPNSDQLGEWSGTLKTWERDLPLTMQVEKDGDVKIRIAGQLQALLNQVSWSGERLTGRFAGRIPTTDAGRHPHVIGLDLRLRDGKLSGQAVAQTLDQPVYFALASYVELRRQSSTDTR
jgi:CubicO group peptidase (beta-lactamase class C family)